MKKLLLILFITLFIPFVLNAQSLLLFEDDATVITYADTARSFNYYVDNTGTGDTLSTIAEVNALTLQGLDTVFFKRGCEWREQLTVPNSGVEGYPIVFTSYGSGDKPIINGTDLITSWNDGSSFSTNWEDDATSDNSGDWTALDASISWDTDHYIFTYTAATQWAYETFTTIEKGDSFRVSVDIKDGTLSGVDVRLLASRLSRNPIHEVLGTTTDSWQTITGSFTADTTLSIYELNSNTGAGNWEFKNCIVENYTTGVVNRYESYLPTISVKIVLFNDTVGTQVANLADVDADKEWFYQNDSLYIYSDGDPTVYYTTVEASRRNYGLYVNSKQYITIDGIKAQYQGISSFMFNGNISGYSTVKNSHAYYSRGNGFYMNNGNSNNTFQDCKAEYTGSGFYSGVDCDNNTFIRDTSNHNIYYDGTVGAYNDGHGFGIEENDGALIEYCYAEDNRDNYTVDQNSQGHSVILRYNQSLSSKSGRYGYNISRLGTGGNSYVYYNLSVNDGVGNGNAFWNQGDNTGNLFIYNNTFYCSADIDGTTIRFYDNSNNVVFKNNIVYHFRTSASGYQAISTSLQGSLNSDYNLFYAPNLGLPFRSGANDSDHKYANLAEWQDSTSMDANGVEADPTFTTNGSDFILQTGSPAINAGTDVGLTQDILGNPIVGLPDIGAYEDQGE